MQHNHTPDLDPGNDFMAGFNDVDDDQPIAGAGAAGAGTGAAAGGDTQQGAGAGVEGAGVAGAGGAEGGDGADAGTAAGATAGDEFAAGVADDGQGGEAGAGTGAASGNTQGVDSSENGEQGRATSGTIDYSGLPDEVRQRLEEADRIRAENEQLTGTLAARDRDYRALYNRVAPIQSKLAALERAQQGGQQGAAEATAGGQQQDNQQGGGTLEEAERAITEAEAYYESDEWKRYEEQWPVEAAVLKRTNLQNLRATRAVAQQTAARVEQVSRTIDTQIAPHLEQVRTERATQARTAELNDLATRHPDWEQINGSDAFWDWFGEQAPLLNFQSEAHMRARLNDGSYVATLLDRYKRDTALAAGTQQQQNNQQQNNQQQQNTAVAGGDAGNAQAVNARLALAGGPERGASQPIPRPGGGITPGDDFMAGFNDPN